MRYEMLNVEVRGLDDMVTLNRKPNPLERLFGCNEEQLTAYGHGDQWFTMDGAEASGRLRRFLQNVWQQHPRSPQAASISAVGQHQWLDPIDEAGEAGEESFPASDPPCWARTTI